MATQKRLARNNNTSVASLNNSKLSLLNQIDEETQINNLYHYGGMPIYGTPDKFQALHYTENTAASSSTQTVDG